MTNNIINDKLAIIAKYDSVTSIIIEASSINEMTMSNPIKPMLSSTASYEDIREHGLKSIEYDITMFYIPI